MIKNLLVSSVFLFFVKQKFYIRLIGIVISLCLCIWAFNLVINLYEYTFWYKGLFFNEKLMIKKTYSFFDLNINGLLDSLSIMLIFLTSILCLTSIILSWNVKKLNFLYILIFILIFFLIMSFLVSHLFFFYIFFEGVLIPMYLIIGIWGSRLRKITAAYRLFLYTIIGSISFLSVIIYLFVSYGTTNIYILKYIMISNKNLEILLWLGLFLALAVKIPLYPLHTWLPEAHAEAPTVGSVLLAGILLKLGPYGLIRFSNFLFPYGMFFWRPLIFLICLMGLYYTSITAIRQTDIKKIIAYSSIGHMALVMLGIFSFTIEGFIGSFLLLIGHGFVSAGLFLIVGLLYERLKTRVFFYYKGLIQIYPLISIYFFLFLLGNIGFPGTLNFISEILIILSLAEINMYLCILVVIASVIVLGFNLFLYGRIFYGAIEMKKNYVSYNMDLNSREVFSILLLLIPMFCFGLIPNNLIELIKINSIFYLNI